MNTLFFLTSSSELIQQDPGITMIITKFLGFFLNIIYNFVSYFFIDNTLGFAIILFTIVVRLMMLPMAVKQSKSMLKMQLIQPEVQKIQDKYKDNRKDPEVARKMQQETQALYQEHGVSLFGGCIPMLIQLPIFIALSYMMNNAYLYVHKLGDLYEQLALTITQIPNWDATLAQIAAPKLVKGVELNFNNVSDIQKVLNKFTDADWVTMLANAPADIVNSVGTQIQGLTSIEHFFGIDLTVASGWLWPGILIPILAAVTTALSSYVMQLASKPQNDQAKSQQKIMLIVMPIFIGFTTVGLSAGVGLYWITSSVFQIIQQLVINKQVIAQSKNNTIEKVEEEERLKKEQHKHLELKELNKNKNKNKNHKNPNKK